MRMRLPDVAVVLASGVVTVLALAKVTPPLLAPTRPTAVASMVSAPAGLPTGAATFEPDTEAPVSGCHFPDKGFGTYGAWQTLDVDDQTPSHDPRRLGKLLWVPSALRSQGAFRLLVHFHGAEPVRKELANAGFDLAIFAVDAGSRSGAYGRLLAGSGAYMALIGAIERKVASITGRADAHASHVAVSSWSAGYAAVSRALAEAPARVNALLLLDSLYAGYMPDGRHVAKASLAPYIIAAQAASRGGAPFFLSHSGVKTDGYASTSEVATALLDALNAYSVAVSGDAFEEEDDDDTAQGGAMKLVRMFDAGRFVIRGYAGAGPDDHCAHLRLLKRALAEEVLPAFDEPPVSP